MNRYYVAVAALKALADDGEIKPEVVAQAIKKYGLDTERPDPWTVIDEALWRSQRVTREFVTWQQ